MEKELEREETIWRRRIVQCKQMYNDWEMEQDLANFGWPGRKQRVKLMLKRETQ